VVSGLTCGATDGNGHPVGSGTPAGTYPITCSGGSAANYSITYKTGTLTINPAPLTITADNKGPVQYSDPLSHQGNKDAGGLLWHYEGI
jgi:hypothetical protein